MISSQNFFLIIKFSSLHHIIFIGQLNDKQVNEMFLNKKFSLKNFLFIRFINNR
jgi:hypothetical protein